MSRVGKMPVAVGSDVKIDLHANGLKVTGPKGSLHAHFPEEVNIEFKDAKITVAPKSASDKARAMWGLSRSLIANMVHGVTHGYTKTLEITGVGYRAAADHHFLTLFLGYSHDIKYVIPKGIHIKCLKPTTIEITGFDKQLVGQVAAEIRKLRKPEPYKGKGIRIDDEKIRRKVGKKK
jgi:large subunit ribosomal protein L6